MIEINIFIGGAWPYANSSLHVGHLAALLPGDVIARFYRQMGEKVVYVSGTDAHGTPITIRAKKENVDPEELSNKYHDEFSKCFEKLDFSYDFYTSTNTEYHRKKVQQLIKDIEKNGYFYKRKSERDFCPSCNEFRNDREITGTCPVCGAVMNGEQCDECLTTFKITEVKEKRCIFCGTETILKQDKDITFKLSMFQNSLEQYFEKNSKNWRLNAVNETKKYLEKGLMDRDITRNLSWGVEVPFEEFSEKKLYVWVEAVLGYLTAAEYTLEQQDMTLEDFFSTSEVVKTYFVHGKDNIPFHTIILPALILAYNEKIKLPDFIISSEFIKTDSDKMSKSKGNVILVKNLIGQYHSDTIRFHFIYNNPEKKDAVFSEKALVMSHNKFLVGTLGNFVNRNLSFIHRKNNGVITEGKTDHEMKLITNELYEKVALMIQTGEIRSALEEIVKYIQVSNKYYDSQKPWIQVKNDLEGFNNTTYTCFFIMVNLANLLKPFLPKCSWNLNRLLGIKDVNKWGVLKINGNYKIKKPNLLYEKIDKF